MGKEKGGEVGAGRPGVTITVIGRGVEIIVLEVVPVRQCHWSAKLFSRKTTA